MNKCTYNKKVCFLFSGSNVVGSFKNTCGFLPCLKRWTDWKLFPKYMINWNYTYLILLHFSIHLPLVALQLRKKYWRQSLVSFYRDFVVVTSRNKSGAQEPPPPSSLQHSDTDSFSQTKPCSPKLLYCAAGWSRSISWLGEIFVEISQVFNAGIVDNWYFFIYYILLITTKPSDTGRTG